MKDLVRLLQDKTPKQIAMIQDMVNKLIEERNIVNTVRFRVIGDTDLHIEYYNNRQEELKPKHHKLSLEKKVYTARSTLDKLTKDKNYHPNDVGNEIMEQFHKPLLGSILGQFNDLKYNCNEVTLTFQNFNFIGALFIMMAIIKHFKTEIGVKDKMKRSNGNKANVEVIETESPTLKITYSKP